MVDTCFGPYFGVPILDNKDPQSEGGGQGGCRGNLPRMGFPRNKEGSKLASESRFCLGSLGLQGPGKLVVYRVESLPFLPAGLVGAFKEMVFV